MPYDDYYDYDEWIERTERFADPGGDSALHVADRGNPRNLKCPTCGWPNRLTERDVASGYHCDSCANAMERGMDIFYYEGDENDDDEDDDDYLVEAKREEEPEPDRLSEADWR